MASPELKPDEQPEGQEHETTSKDRVSKDDDGSSAAPAPAPSIFAKSDFLKDEPTDSRQPVAGVDNGSPGIQLPPPPEIHQVLDLPPESRKEPLEKVLKQEVERSQPETKIGLLGGGGVGKTYFFYGMMYRTLDEDKSGAVSYYLQSSELRRYDRRFGDANGQSKFEDSTLDFNLALEVKRYESWERYVPTTFEAQLWYRLRLGFKTGFLGGNHSYLDLEFLDGSGEGFSRPLGSLTMPIWEAAFRNAGIMIFCLPIWAAFPAPGLSTADQELREDHVSEFHQVLKNYLSIRSPGRKVRSILALTMADDDRRCALQDMIDRWITPYIEDSERVLEQLRSRSGIPRYLASAQAVSDYLHRQFRLLRGKPLVSKIPKMLDFGLGRPWIIPVSAIDGKILEKATDYRKRAPDASIPEQLDPPIPVHVELPLLAALCENHNALM